MAPYQAGRGAGDEPPRGEHAIRIRRAAELDAGAITRLVEAAYAPYLARGLPRPAPMDDDYDRKVTDDEVWIADDAGAVAGILILVPQPDHLLLENVAVDPAHQGRGIGRQLLRVAETRAAQLRLPELRLYTQQGMTENVELYGRFGYQETERRVEHGLPRVFMTKVI